MNKEAGEFQLAKATKDQAALLASMIVALYLEDHEGPVDMSPARAARQVGEILSLQERADPPVQALMILRDQEAVGYLLIASFWSNEFGGRTLYIDELFVQPSWRGKGVGTESLMLLQYWSESKGVQRLSLEVNRGNARAESLYRRLGFRSEERITLSMQLQGVQN